MLITTDNEIMYRLNHTAKNLTISFSLEKPHVLKNRDEAGFNQHDLSAIDTGEHID